MPTVDAWPNGLLTRATPIDLRGWYEAFIVKSALAGEVPIY